MIHRFKMTPVLMMLMIVMNSTHARAGEEGLLESGAGEEGDASSAPPANLLPACLTHR